MDSEQLAALEPVVREYHDASERLVLETSRGVAARRERADRAQARLTMALLQAGFCTLPELALRLIEERADTRKDQAAQDLAAAMRRLNEAWALVTEAATTEGEDPASYRMALDLSRTAHDEADAALAVYDLVCR